MILAAELLGRTLPNPGIGLVFVALAIGFFLVNRSDSSAVDKVGSGPERECLRCGRRFHPEQVELLATGDVRRTHDERCPSCGWDYELGDPDKR